MSWVRVRPCHCLPGRAQPLHFLYLSVQPVGYEHDPFLQQVLRILSRCSSACWLVNGRQMPLCVLAVPTAVRRSDRERRERLGGGRGGGADDRGSRRNVCYTCGAEGHWARDCTARVDLAAEVWFVVRVVRSQILSICICSVIKCLMSWEYQAQCASLVCCLSHNGRMCKSCQQSSHVCTLLLRIC